jgi:hypothetical protein
MPMWDEETTFQNRYINIYCSCAEYTDELRFEELVTNNIVPTILLLATPTPLSSSFSLISESQSHIETDGQSVSQ